MVDVVDRSSRDARTAEVSPVRLSRLAIAALALAVFLPPLGLVLGVLAYARIRRRPTLLAGQKLALGAVVIPMTVVPVMLLAGISMPGYLQRYDPRAEQAEARITLSQLRVAQAVFIAEHGGPVRSDATPAAPPAAGLQPWEPRRCPAACPGDRAACTELSCLGFAPAHALMFRYACEVAGPSYTCAAVADSDADGHPLVMVYGTAPAGVDSVVAPVPALAQGLCRGAVPARAIHTCTPGEQ